LCHHNERKYVMFFTGYRTECPWQRQFYRIESRHIPWHIQCCRMWYKTRDVQCFLVVFLLGGKAFWLDNYLLCPCLHFFTKFDRNFMYRDVTRLRMKFVWNAALKIIIPWMSLRLGHHNNSTNIYIYIYIFKFYQIVQILCNNKLEAKQNIFDKTNNFWKAIFYRWNLVQSIIRDLFTNWRLKYYLLFSEYVYDSVAKIGLYFKNPLEYENLVGLRNKILRHMC